jgi:hypothetical protein
LKKGAKCMIKKIFSLVVCIMLFVYPVSASNMYNYVHNGTSWVPALATADGQQKYWINMANASYGEVQYNLTVGQNIVVSGNLNVTGVSYLSNTRINAENVSFKSGGEFFANSTSVYYNNGSLVTDLRINNLPANAVMSFNQASCPTGWSLADGTGGTPDLRGIFVRGAGTNSVVKMANGSFMTATYGQYQNDSFQGHWHEFWQYLAKPSFSSLNEVGAVGGDAPLFKSVSPPDPVKNATTAGAATGTPRTDAETRPASYALIYCVKTAEDSEASNSIWNIVGNIVKLVNTTQTLEVGNLNVTGNFVGTKQYVGTDVGGGGNFNITSSQGGYSLKRAVAIPYQTIDGAWWLRGYASYTVTNTARTGDVVTIYGVTFKTISGGNQVVTANVGNVPIKVSRADSGTNTITIVHDSTTTSAYDLFFEVELDSKPTWAD